MTMRVWSIDDHRARQLLDDAEHVWILSGAGERGHWERHTGKRSLLAVKRHVVRLLNRGDRWAHVVSGPVAYDKETGSPQGWDWTRDDYRELPVDVRA